MFAFKHRYRNRAAVILWYALLLFFSYLMLLITLQYIPARTDVAFLRIKEDVIEKPCYQLAFFAHVYTGMLVFMAGMIQFSQYIRGAHPAIHRWCGRIYAICIIFITGPAGLFMGYYGNGGLISQTAFCLLAITWIFSTTKGVQAARSHNIITHKKWMYRSYALTLSAISLRLWKWLLVLLFHPRPMDVYHVVSWLGWVGNLVIVEYYIRHTRSPQLKNV